MLFCIRKMLSLSWLANLAWLSACGNSSVEQPSSESCIGSPVVLSPFTDTIAVGDSTHVTARPFALFASCFPGVAFVVRWEASPASAVALTVDSDTTTWVRGLLVGRVVVVARGVQDERLVGGMEVTIR